MTPQALADLMEATWPAARAWRLGGFMLRDGQGGGKRVSAASAEGDWHLADIDAAEDDMTARGERPLFLLCPQDVTLDAALAARGYARVDPVVAYAAPVAALGAEAPARLSAFTHWPPLVVISELWAEAGIGEARQAVMARVASPKTVIMGRAGDRVAGAAFVAASGSVAMLHALEVRPGFRRRGAARNILRAAARWAAEQGAEELALVVTEANAPARALYEALGMSVIGGYHYRQA